MDAAAGAVVYTVPDGFVLLLKDARLRPHGSVEWTADMYAAAAGGGPAVFVIHEIGTAGTPITWEGWIALNGLDVISLATTGDAVDYWISGALLPYASALPVGAIPA